MKAFDRVPREILFIKLYNFGIRGKMLRVIQDIYHNNKARILLGKYLSPEFSISSGVMQGSKLGPILFIIFINDLLETLNDSGLGANIESLIISCLGFADDIVLTSDCPKKMQKLIDICFQWAQQNHMKFNSDKCKVMVLNKPWKSISFTLNNKILDIVKSYKYLGITFANRRLTSLYTEYFALMLEKANRRLQCIKHYGFHKDGLRPETAIKMYKLLVRPILEYGAQVLIFNHHYLSPKTIKNRVLNRTSDFVEKIEHFQNQALKSLLGCPKSSSPAVVRLFSGVESMVSRIDLLQLRYFWKLSRSDENNIAHTVFNLRKKRFLATKKGFLHEIFNLCCKYDIVNLWHGNLQTALNPKSFLKQKVLAFNFREDFEVGRNKSCGFVDVYLKNSYFDLEGYQLVQPFKQFDFFASAKARSLIIKVLLYPRVFKVDCKLCSNGFKNIFDHYVHNCNYVRTQRKRLRNILIFYNFSKEYISNKRMFLLSCLEKRSWTKRLTSFLEEVGY